MSGRAKARRMLAMSAAVAAALGSYGPAARAATKTWDPGATDGTVVGGAGNWDTATANWTTDGGVSNTMWTAGSAGAAADAAVFGGTVGTVTLTTGINAQGITFNSGYTVTGNTLTLDAGATVTVTNAADTATISSVLASGATASFNGANTTATTALIKAGAGTLTLSGTNTFAGDILVNAGTLVAANSNALSTFNPPAGPGGTPVAGGSATNPATRVIINGATAQFTLNGGYDANAGATFDEFLVGTNGGTLNIVTGQTLTLNDAGQFGDAPSPFAPTAATVFTKAGPGTLLLNSQTFAVTFQTVVTDGTLRTDAANTLGTGSTPITVNGTGAFDVRATLGGTHPITISGAGFGSGGALISGGTGAVGTVTLAGNASIGGAGTLTIAAIDAGAGSPARTITKTGTGFTQVTGAGTNFTGTTVVTGTGGIGLGSPTAFGPAATISITTTPLGEIRQTGAAQAGYTYTLPTDGILAGDNAFLASVNPGAGGNLTNAFPTVIAETEAGATAALATRVGFANDSTRFFGIAGDLTDSFTVSGTLAGITPWRGVSSDRVTRNLNGGTITAASNFALQGPNGVNLQFGGITLTPADAVTGHVTLGRLNLTSATPTYNSKITYTIASGAAIQFAAINATGTGASSASNAGTVAYSNGTIDPGGGTITATTTTGTMSGPVLLEAGSFLTLNDANNFGGQGVLSGEPGAILDVSNATFHANSTATQNMANLPAGTVVRLGVAVTALTGANTFVPTTPTATSNASAPANPAHVFEVRNGDRSNAVILSASTPPRAGFLSGVYTNDNAARIATGTVMIGPGGGTLAAAGATFTVNAPITVLGTAPTSLTFGTNLIIDPAISNAGRNAGVTLGGANVYDNGTGGVINQVNVRGRATAVGTNTGAGNLPQGTGVGLDLGGTFQINGVAAGGTVPFGTLKPNGGILFLNRNATPTAGLIVNLNSPINRPSAFGPENRGSATLMLLAGQVFGTSLDKVTFANAANAPARVAAGVNMVAPWIVGTDSGLPNNNTTFLDIVPGAETTNGFVPVTYVAMPLTGGAGTEIADNTAASTLTGDITVAALRTNSNISGTNTINLTTGGLLMRSAAITIAANINFGANEGVIGVVQTNNAETISGKISGTGGLTKFGQGSLSLSNAANDFTGGVTINEANLRPGVASTATASPFGFNATTGFGVVTVNTAGTLDMNGIALTIGGLQGTGFVNGATVVLTMNVATGNTFTFGGTFTSNTMGVAKAGSGSQILTGTLAYTGATTVSAGLLQVDGYSTAASAYTVNSGGTLGGRGIITGAVAVASGGNLAPGAGGPGLLRTGSLTAASGSNYVVDLNGITAGSGYDQTEVIGTVNVTGANLVATLGGGYVPAAGDKLYIVNNDGFDPITGTFTVNGTPAPQGSTVTIGGVPFTISYNGEFFGGGTTAGNDVVLIAQVPEPASVGLLGLAAVGLLARRRRRHGPAATA